MGQLSEAPFLTFHKSFKICPVDPEMFTHIRNLWSVRRMSLGRYYTTVIQTFGTRYDEWISDRPSPHTFLFSNYFLKMIDTEYIPDGF